MNPTQAQLNAATNKCVNALSANAQLIGCIFEDDAGRAEDQRTGLTCSARQAALAQQCRKRCADFASASSRTWCPGMDQNIFWHDFFGYIGGEAVGSACVQSCGLC
jgi:hypothetical protein